MRSLLTLLEIALLAPAYVVVVAVAAMSERPRLLAAALATVGEVAREAMGVVYRARDTATGAIAALTRMLASRSEDRARFDREVYSASCTAPVYGCPGAQVVLQFWSTTWSTTSRVTGWIVPTHLVVGFSNFLEESDARIASKRLLFALTR